jgi:hypothetical protein
MLTLAFLLVISHGCYYDNAQELFTCNPSEVSYAEDVAPILVSRCYECHDVTNAPSLGDGILLEGHGNLVAYLQDNEIKFIGSIEWNGQGSPMPKNSTRLDNCSVNTINTWIAEGKRNN